MGYGKKQEGFEAFISWIKSEEYLTSKKSIFLESKEEYLTDIAIKRLKSAMIRPEFVYFDFTEICLFDEPNTDVIDSIFMVPMGSKRRLVVVDANKGKAPHWDTKISKLCEEANGNIGLIVIVGSSSLLPATTALIRRLSHCFDFGRLKMPQLISFLEKQCGKLPVKPPIEAINYIIELSGYLNNGSEYNLNDFVNDISKFNSLLLEFIHFRDGDTKLTKGHWYHIIQRAIVGEENVFIFDFMDNIFRKNKDEALLQVSAMMNKMKQPAEALKIISTLINQMELMLAVKELSMEQMRGDDIAVVLKAHKFRIGKIMESVASMSLHQIKRELIRCYSIEVEYKKGILDIETALESFVAFFGESS